MGKTFKEKPDKWRKQLNGKKNKKHHNGWKPMSGSTVYSGWADNKTPGDYEEQTND